MKNLVLVFIHIDDFILWCIILVGFYLMIKDDKKTK
jgi:hypothetical protein